MSINPVMSNSYFSAPKPGAGGEKSTKFARALEIRRQVNIETPKIEKPPASDVVTMGRLLKEAGKNTGDLMRAQMSFNKKYLTFQVANKASTLVVDAQKNAVNSAK